MKKKNILIISALFSLLILIGLFLFLNNRNIHIYEQVDVENTTQLTLVGNLNIDLDTITSPYNMSSIEYIAENNSIVFLNKSRQTIYWYDANTGEIQYTTQLNKEGDNGVGEINFFKVLKKDSIFVYAYKYGLMSIVDSKGNLVRKLGSFIAKDTLPKKYYGIPDLIFGEKIHLANDNIYTTCSSDLLEVPSDADSLNLPVVVIYNTSVGKLSAELGYPKLYTERSWGGAQATGAVYSELQGDKLVLSFTMSPFLYVYDTKNKIVKRYYAGSGKAVKFESITPKQSMEALGRIEHYLSNPTYEHIIYDPYRACYYRMLLLPAPLGDDIRNLVNKSEMIKRLVVIILDKDFNYIGETFFGDQLYSNLDAFVSEKGLHLARLPFNQEDQLVYDIFIPEKVK
jgi:hypothetical protein